MRSAYRVESDASERACYHPHVPGGRLSEHVDAYSRRTIMKDSERASRSSVLGRRRFIKAAAGAGAGLGAVAAMHPGAAAAADTPLQAWWDARPSSAKANRPVAIDLHAHWVPPPYAKAMADLGHPLGNCPPCATTLSRSPIPRTSGSVTPRYAPSGVGAMACAGDGGRFRSSCGNAATSSSMIVCIDTRAVGRRCSSTTGTWRKAP